jgi:DNA topoisomerase-1
MAKNLVIVESPAKAKTISRFLGSSYKVLASMGHVRDLPKSKIGIDVEHDFEPSYIVSADKKKTVKALKDQIKSDTTVWLATDEDREGEAIGWHLLSALKIDPAENPVKRIVFHEITKKAIEDAVMNPRDIDLRLVDAQQARRVLDRLVGYELSPLLWKKVGRGLSAGRVQSVAVRLVVEREREIRAFKPEEFWKIKGDFAKMEADEFGRRKFSAVLEKNASNEKLRVKDDADAVLTALQGASYKIGTVEQKEVKRNPSAPFTTSTLQQEASRKLGFSVKKTMMLAQKLYEGVDIGHGEHGLITYMRTDSVNLSQIALTQAREIISNDFGAEYALALPRYYKSKKGAQEAHEAIRPVDLSIKPSEVTGVLEKDLARLYELIWKRTIACQMAEAILDQVNVEVVPFREGASTNDNLSGLVFRAKGETIAFPGFIKVYMEDLDEDEMENGGFGGVVIGGVGAKSESEGGNSQAQGEDSHGREQESNVLPGLTEGESVENLSLNALQHFTKPPARYTEASLVKKLESEGIGRPSTYAPTISTVQQRGYVKKDGKYLIPSDVGEVVTDLLVANFAEIVDYKFTAGMEEDLDKIAEGEKQWVPVIKAFYGPFHANLEEKMKTLQKSDIVNEKTDEVCEKCGSPMIIKLGRYGKFLACSNYPECKNTKPLNNGVSSGGAAGSGGTGGGASGTGLVGGGLVKPVDEKLEQLKKEHSGKICEKCGKEMTVRKGRYGYFLGCTGYPKCKNIVSLDGVSNNTGVKCPKCGKNDLVEKRTRRGGKVFWGCSGYPKCKFASWDKPLKNCKSDVGIDGIMVEKDGATVCVVPED